MGFKTTFKFSSLNKLEKAFKNGVRQGLQTTNIQLAGNKGDATSGLIKQEMNKPKTGTIYPVIVKRGRTYRNHQASNRSGLESSAILDGQLARSVKGETKGSSRLEISANTPYAALQEKGGKNGRGAYVAPRNNLKRPIESSRRNIINNIDNSIRSGLK
jgi:hypothetical protein